MDASPVRCLKLVETFSLLTTTYADGQQTEEIMFMADCLADVV